jgi:restriction system protein
LTFDHQVGYVQKDLSRIPPAEVKNMADEEDEPITIYGQPFSIYGQPFTRSVFEKLAGFKLTDFNPALVLPALLTFRDHNIDGEIIESVEMIPWKMIKREIEKDPNFMYKIDPRKFEEMVAASYHEEKFDEVILTPRSGDLGRDVIATKHGLVTVRVIESVKRYRPGNLVTAEEVRSLAFLMLADKSVTHGVVTTSSDFAPKIKTDRFLAPYLNTNQLKLINGIDITKRILIESQR